MINPSSEGVDHINSYSRSTLVVGRLLSNFAPCDINTTHGHYHSVEAYWSFLMTGVPTNDITDPIQARTVLTTNPRRLQCSKQDFQLHIADAISQKLNQNKDFLLSDPYFCDLSLPIVHYWVRAGEYVETGNKESTTLLLDSLNAWRRDMLIWGF